MTPAWLIALVVVLVAAIVTVQIAHARTLRESGDAAQVRVALGIRVVNIGLVLVAGGLVLWALLR